MLDSEEAGGNCLETGIGSCLAGRQRPANSELLEVKATMDSTCPQGEVGPRSCPHLPPMW